MNGPAETQAFQLFSSELRDVLDMELRRLLDARAGWAGGLGDDVAVMVGAVRSLALRGGKRLRAALIGAALEGFGVSWRDAVPALAANRSRRGASRARSARRDAPRPRPSSRRG